MIVLPSLQRVFANPACGAALLLALAGCANWQAPAEVSDAALRARAITTTVRDVRVTAAVLSAQDSVSMLGADVNKTNVQAVWIEVENRTSQSLLLLRSGTDPDYFSPLEMAWSLHAPLAVGTNAASTSTSLASASGTRSRRGRRARASSSRNHSLSRSCSMWIFSGRTH